MLLKNMFQSAPEKTFKLLWTLRDKKSHWFKKYEDMESFIKQSSNQDLYFGLGVTYANLTNFRRAKASQISGIKCVYLDIDFQDPTAHKKRGLPEDIDEAIKIAKSVLEPTYLVNSGHGLHAYFLFDEWYMMTDNESKDRGAKVVFDFQETVKQKNKNYSLDSVHDLSRVLRVPGSTNCKDPKNQVKCEIIEENLKNIYTIEEIEDCVQYDKTKTTTLRTTKVKKAEADLFSGFKLDPNASIDPVKFAELVDIFKPNFTKCFENTKKIYDPSASGYDFALISYGYQANLSDQELVDLMIQHRRTRGHDLKFDNPQYYSRSVQKIASESKKKTEEFKFDENATINNDKFSKLCSDHNPDFIDLFNDTAEIKDPSPEGYDQALATLCVQDKMPHQDIIDLLIYHRRQRGHDLFMQKPAYYTDTIKAAEREKRLDNLKQDPTQKASMTEKEQIREKVYDLTGMNIKNIYRYNYDPDPVFFIQLENGKKYKLGIFKNGIADQSEFVAKYVSHTLSNVEAISTKKWRFSVLPYLLKLTIDKEVPEDATYKGRADDWPRKYFETKNICENIDECFEMGGNSPFWYNGDLYFSLKNMIKWLNNNEMDTRNADFEISLLQNGFKIKRVRYKDKRYRFWKAPKNYLSS